jgi:MFS family permease
MNLFKLYAKSYSGLSKPAWILALVVLINRTGTMVLPFLSLYLREARGLTLAETGIILSLFGLGALAGSFLGGWLTDKFGSFAVQTGSLIGGGICFLILKNIESFEGLAAGFFLTTVVTDSLRPANSTAVAEYAKKKNLTRAYSLNRMAINLGFAIGPAIGGFLAATDYSLLFYVDGFTCIFAGLLFAFFFARIPKNQEPASVVEPSLLKPKPPWKDSSFLVFVLFVAAYGTVFFQLFTTIPLYYREVYILPENQIGWLLALNGALVFLIEMPLVAKLGNKVNVKKIVSSGALLAGSGLLLFNLAEGIAILVMSMTLLSISEILAMPFMTTYTVQRANDKTRGRYLGMYSVGYSIAFIAAPAVGTYLINYSGYNFLWYALSAFSCLVALALYQNMADQRNLHPKSANSTRA